ncbi:hypothetical protein Mgra_00001062 [Meloidogyne graminicola]|uniref:Uncharacterized protein n=1 Tax=Meloidogyne graminicola TaxID=189291 RepID=A0A8T0A1J5_9BILA|nr:hypothetical protein Mgra_00001062 [Meloidogyne graminicola]
MKILNLFLIFIQFALCLTVDLMTEPGELFSELVDIHKKMLNPSINKRTLEELIKISENNPNIMYPLTMNEINIIAPPTIVSITQQYEQFKHLLFEFKKNLKLIEETKNNHMNLDLKLGRDIDFYENSIKINKTLQNIVIQAMYNIHYEVNNLNKVYKKDLEEQNQQNVHNIISFTGNEAESNHIRPRITGGGNGYN